MKKLIATATLALSLVTPAVSARAASDASDAVPAMIAAEGRTFDLTLKDPAALKGFQVGDQVEGSYLQVLAIGVVTPPVKK